MDLNIAVGFRLIIITFKRLQRNFLTSIRFQYFVFHFDNLCSLYVYKQCVQFVCMLCRTFPIVKDFFPLENLQKTESNIRQKRWKQSIIHLKCLTSVAGCQTQDLSQLVKVNHTLLLMLHNREKGPVAPRWKLLFKPSQVGCSFLFSV